MQDDQDLCNQVQVDPVHVQAFCNLVLDMDSSPVLDMDNSPVLDMVNNQVRIKKTCIQVKVNIMSIKLW